MNIFYAKNRNEWREWLQNNYETEKEIWFVFPQDILDEIKSDSIAWENYQNFSDAYKRMRVAYIDAAHNQPLEFQKRLNSFIAKTHRNHLIVGYGGVDKYYGDPK